MLRFLTFVIALVVAAFAAGPTASADETDPDDLPGEAVIDDPSEAEALADDFGLAHRRRIYENSRLERRRALLYTAALPGLGNFYAEQYAIGTVAMMSTLFSAMFIGYGVVNDHSDLVGLGIVTAGLTYTASGTLAYLGVRSHNTNLRRSLHIDDPHGALFSTHRPDDDVWMVELQWRF